MNNDKKKSSPEKYAGLLKILEVRFRENSSRHKGLEWDKVLTKLQANPEKLDSLDQMEETGGEPDVVNYDKKTGKYIFDDCL